MISMNIQAKIGELEKALGEDAPKKLKREIKIALNAAAKKTESLLAKEIYKEIMVSQKAIKKDIDISSKATEEKLSATVRQKENARLSLKEFKPRQNKKGVRYRVSRKSGGKFIAGAFISEALGGHVYKRVGKARNPIDKKHGVSPWGVTVVNNLDKLIVERDIEPTLIKQIERRIQAVNFKKSQG